MWQLSLRELPPTRFIPGNKAEARSRLGLSSSYQIVGTAGRLVPVKAHHILLRAMAELPENVDCAMALSRIWWALTGPRKRESG